MVNCGCRLFLWVSKYKVYKKMAPLPTGRYGKENSSDTEKGKCRSLTANHGVFRGVRLRRIAGEHLRVAGDVWL